MTRDDLPNYDERERWLEDEPDNRNPETARAEARARRVADARSRLIGELRSGEPSTRQPALDAVAARQDVVPETSSKRQHGGLTAFIYARVSTREQARTGGGEEEGYSIPAQREVCTDKARQLNAAVTGIYVDTGESAKTANRPELQRMLRDVRKQRPTYVIVHKIDRLARNREDDIAINLALKKAGTTLVSCTENVTDTPSGRFLYNIMADMAQFYSDNLAQEVLNASSPRPRDGGTPHRAPLGYLHKREYLGGVMTSWVELDPERAPLVRWAFERYATGDWTVVDLFFALREKGLTTRPGPSSPVREVSVNTLHKVLRNPYYLGVVSYQGATYEGKHQALIDTASGCASRICWLPTPMLARRIASTSTTCAAPSSAVSAGPGWCSAVARATAAPTTTSSAPRSAPALRAARDRPSGWRRSSRASPRSTDASKSPPPPWRLPASACAPTWPPRSPTPTTMPSVPSGASPASKTSAPGSCRPTTRAPSRSTCSKSRWPA